MFGDRHGSRDIQGSTPFDSQAGPVDITRSAIAAKSPTRILGGAKNAYRPRATTESGPRRHATIDIPESSVKSLMSNMVKDMAHSAEQGTIMTNQNENDRKMPTIIKYNGQGKDVYVCGTFNDWQKLKMSKSQKDFVAIVDLGEGDHEYKFLVDGNWITDPSAAVVETETGYKNNLIHVQKEDFDAYDALDMDSASVAKSQSHRAKNNEAQACFGQEIPHLGGTSVPIGDHHQQRAPGPPILPPHLLQVILNKDTPMSCEPTLLPEPNHVMLNHLYALSIKDGVMVLSTTRRYKRKYVTTLLYKPMGLRKSELSEGNE